MKWMKTTNSCPTCRRKVTRVKHVDSDSVEHVEDTQVDEDEHEDEDEDTQVGVMVSIMYHLANAISDEIEANGDESSNRIRIRLLRRPSVGAPGELPRAIVDLVQDILTSFHRRPVLIET